MLSASALTRRRLDQLAWLRTGRSHSLTWTRGLLKCKVNDLDPRSVEMQSQLICAQPEPS